MSFHGWASLYGADSKKRLMSSSSFGWGLYLLAKAIANGKYFFESAAVRIVLLFIYMPSHSLHRSALGLAPIVKRKSNAGGLYK